MRDEFEEILLLQTEFSASNTPAMQRRGVLIRSGIPQQLRQLLTALEFECGVDDLRVQGKDGTGMKTEIPWIRIYSASRSPAATTGWYLAHLFSAAGDRLYLSLNQGTTRWTGVDFRARPEAELVARVAWARQLLTREPDYPGSCVERIQLDGIRSSLGRGYELGNVIAAEYSLDNIPGEEQLEEDLRRAARWLGVLYEATDRGLYVPGEPGPEIVDAEAAIDVNAGNARRRGGQGVRLTAAEKEAVEQRAVDVVSEHLFSLGYAVKDVGKTESFDLDARKDGQKVKVEVKGTTSTGEEIILTRNEVELHREHFPANALAIVHSIELDRSVDPPIADKGILSY